MTEPSVKIDVIFVGQTGVGKSTIINMIMGLSDDHPSAAKVSGETVPCTTHTSSYLKSLGPGMLCQLWDTRGLNEAVERSFMSKIMDRIRQLTSQQERELEKTLRDRTRTTKPILMWCIDGAKIEVSPHWQQFRKIYVEYCERKAIPAIVITRRGSNEWESKCREQLRLLDMGAEPEVHLLRVREHGKGSSTEYTEDCSRLRDFISGFMNPSTDQ